MFGASVTLAYPFETIHYAAVGVLAAIVAIVIGLITVAVKSDSAHFEERLEKIGATLIIFLTPKRLLFQMLMPKMIDSLFEGYSQYAKLNVRVRFPEPTEDFAGKLKSMRAQHLAPSIAAVPDAIMISRKEILGKQVDWQHTAIAARKDPVLYYKKDGLVAVFAQFGDFPKEHELMTTLSSIDFLE
jgi:hypothetical protein